jgi:hypothetical protein
MFKDILNTAHLKIATVRSIIKMNDILRDMMFGNHQPFNSEEARDTRLTALREHVPDKQEWEVYDHCAVVTRLYAIYERFVEALISEWLTLLPEIVAIYSDLADKIQTTHKMGVGQVLQSPNRFPNLSVIEIIQGLFDGEIGEQKYKLLNHAFLIHDENLRQGALVKLLADAGIKDAWQWIVKHRSIKKFINDHGKDIHVEDDLEQLIKFRNDAAHGEDDNDVLQSKELLILADFVENLCQALAELVTYHVFLKKQSKNQVQSIGKITNWFNKPKAATAKLKNVTLSTQTRLFLVGEAYCRLAQIEGIRDNNNVSKERMDITSETEVGLKFDIEAKKGLDLYILLEDE